MSKKELRNLIKEIYDRAILEGEVEFSDKYPELKGMKMTSTPSAFGGVLFVRLHFGSGHLSLCPKDMNRSKMISVFTEFIWTYTNT